jgi:hypothetical protein
VHNGNDVLVLGGAGVEGLRALHIRPGALDRWWGAEPCHPG